MPGARNRCPQTRVGLLPDPEGKGTDSSCSMWTPSSPHSTSWSTTSATPIRRKSEPGPQASLSESEVITLAIFARWSRFREREGLLPLRPDQPARCLPYPARSLAVQPPGALLYGAHRGFRLAPGEDAREPNVLTKPWTARRCPSGTQSVEGMDGWPDDADIGWSNSMGWYEGFRLLTAVDPYRGDHRLLLRAASTADQQVAETFFALRAYPNPRLISVGRLPRDPTCPDKGFEGAENHLRWLESYGAQSSIRPNATPRSPGPSA